MSQQTATERAVEINAFNRARTNLEGGMYFELVTDAVHWDEYGVWSGVELDAYLAHCDYMSLYKDVHGIKPRWTQWQDKDAVGWDLECQMMGDFYRDHVRCEREEDARGEVKKVNAMKCEPLTFNPFAGLVLR